MKSTKIPVTSKTQIIEQLICIWFHSEKIMVLSVSLINGMTRRVAALKQAKEDQAKYY